MSATALSETKTVTMKLPKKAAVNLTTLKGRHQWESSGAQPPISCLDPGCCIHLILYLKNVAPLAVKSWRQACHTPITYLLSISLASCNLKNRFRRFVPHVMEQYYEFTSGWWEVIGYSLVLLLLRLGCRWPANFLQVTWWKCRKTLLSAWQS